MRPLRTRGFALAELIVVLGLIGWLLIGITLTLRTASRTTVTSVRALSQARLLSTTHALLTASVPGTDATDLQVGIRDTLDFDLRIGEGVTCAPGTGGGTIAAHPTPWSRLPEPGRDLVLALTALSPAVWQRRALLDLVPSTCADSRPAFTLATPPGPPIFWLRIITPVRVRAYRSGSARWLGLEERNGLASIQPFAGPFTGELGTTLTSTLLRVGWAGAPPILLPLGERY